jgi:acyl-CoA thioesterase-1
MTSHALKSHSVRRAVGYFRPAAMSAAVSLAALLCCSAAKAETLLVLGDSLSAGYGLDAGRGWVALLEKRLHDTPKFEDWTVVNASISGDTTAGGLARLPEALKQHQPQLVLIELGGNDGLRGQSVDAMKTNLSKIVELSRAENARPVLMEMQIPSNYGPVYTQKFTLAYTAVANTFKVPLVPFFLAKIATDPDRWFQEDGIHPKAEAQPQMLDAVWPTLEPLLSSSSEAKKSGH